MRNFGYLMIPALLAAPLHAELPGCVRGNVPAASLLIPYFEVDLDDPNGRTTLFSVNNAGAEPTAARVTLWTNWSLPTYSFDIFLKQDDVQTINMRDVLNGILPTTGSGTGPLAALPQCTDPISHRSVDFAELRTQHLGLPTEDNLCFGATADGLAVGYLTVDALNNCSPTSVFPSSEGYFAAGGTGVASNDNFLWGDFFLIEPNANLAQGLEAVALEADATITSGRSFYQRNDNRRRLPSTWAARYMNGGAFAGGTDYLLWVNESELPRSQGFDCEVPPKYEIGVRFRTEAGILAYSQDPVMIDNKAQRLRVGGSILPVAEGFGRVEITGFYTSPFFPPFRSPTQTFVAPLFSANGRFSVGFRATAVDSSCLP